MKNVKRKRGRPKGSKNKITKEALEFIKDFPNPKIGSTLRIRLPNDYVVTNSPTEPPSYLSRLEAATVKYEQAVNEAIEALKGK